MSVETSHVTVEQLVESIVRDVIAELRKRGVRIGPPHTPPLPPAPGATTLEIDMSAYRTPVLTEHQLARVDPGVSTIIVPCSTVVAPGARVIIRQRKLTLVRKASSH